MRDTALARTLGVISERSPAHDRSEMTVNAPAGARMVISEGSTRHDRSEMGWIVPAGTLSGMSERSRAGVHDQVDTIGVRS
jgi:hypothetical protein